MKTRMLSRFVAMLLLAGATFTASAAAVPASQTILTPAGVTWSTWTGSGGWTLGDASYAGHGDAYDDAWLLFVNGIGYSPGTVDLTGTTLTGPVQSMSGLNVSMQYYFAPNTAVARILVTLHNPGPASVPATVYVPTNYGSDGSTIYQTTSSNDALVTTADRWIISSDSYGPSDPVNTSVFYGPGAMETPTSYTTTVHSAAGSEGIGATFQLDIPAGATQSLMFFAGLNGITSSTNTVAAAQAAVTSFDTFETLLPEWLDGLTGTQLAQLVNWIPSELPTTTCASEGYTGTKLEWCKNICERGYTGGTLAMWIRRWTDRYRTLPYCAVAPQPTLR